MRRFLIGVSLCVGLGCSPVVAAFDFKDYDDELMRDLERTVKYFEPDITAKNAEAAKEDAGVLSDGFRYTEDYFAKKGNAADAVEISRKGAKLIAEAQDYVEKADFEAAAASAREAVSVCKSCHEIYKPRLGR